MNFANSRVVLSPCLVDVVRSSTVRQDHCIAVANDNRLRATNICDTG